MKKIHLTVLLVVVMIGLPALLRSEENANLSAPPDEIRIRTYNMAKIPSTTIQVMGQEVVRIFAEAGLQVVWLDCNREEDAPRCESPMTPGDFVLRLVVPTQQPSNPSKVQTLGRATVSQQGGALATVVCHPVESLPNAAQSIYEKVLGHSAAHEIGHLLLGGSKAHHYKGIMRGRMDDFDWQRMTAGTLLFNRDQAESLRASLSARFQMAQK
jgi:hypothetical protein